MNEENAGCSASSWQECGALRYQHYPLNEDLNRTSLLISVHGWTRDVRSQIELMQPVADALNAQLITPLFDGQAFSDYQRLGRRGKGLRADLALLELLQMLKKHTNVSHCYLHGFSGGAQFAHRFMFAHPYAVDAVAITSAGWFTCLDRQHKYPYGLRTAGQLPGVRIDPNNFLRVPTLTVVGTQDTGHDRSVRSTPKLNRRQGDTRLERATTWAHELAEAATAIGAENIHHLKVLDGVGHSFADAIEAGLGKDLIDFFSGQLSER